MACYALGLHIDCTLFLVFSDSILILLLVNCIFCVVLPSIKLLSVVKY